VSGTVHNRYGATATRVQFFVESLDDKGNVVPLKPHTLAGKFAKDEREEPPSHSRVL